MTFFLTESESATLQDDLLKIFNGRSPERQGTKFIEEMGELIQAMSKLRVAEGDLQLGLVREDDLLPYRLDYLEEMADVYVMLMQHLAVLHPEDRKQVAEIVLYKVKRELKRLKADDEKLYARMSGK